MGTETSRFGVSKRESHDSSAFYSRNLYNAAPETKPSVRRINPFPEDYRNQVVQADSRQLDFLPDDCLHLMVTSPPYNVGKDYDDNLSLEDYLALMEGVMREVYRVLVPGGRACINIANVGRKPYIPLTDFINRLMIDIGFTMRGEIIWDKAASSGGSCAWGSWRSAANPVLRDVHEYILVFCKESFSRIDNRDKTKENTIERDEFLEYTKSIWQFNAESAKRVRHPAPFPVELPYRLTQLYTFADDIVLDPFCGSGSTCIAALQSQRGYIGVDVNPEYVQTAQERIALFQTHKRDVIKQKKKPKESPHEQGTLL